MTSIWRHVNEAFLIFQVTSFTFGLDFADIIQMLGDNILCYIRFSYRKTSNISRTLAGNKIVDHSDVVRASPVDAAPTTSSFST